jgi:hypothetical protein
MNAGLRERMADMSEERTYRAFPVLTRSELIEELNSSDPRRVADALGSAARYDDWQWTQEQCLRLLKAPEVEIRWAAATCLGDLAFFFNRPIDRVRVFAALYDSAKDAAISDPALFSISLINQRFPPS